MTAQIIDVMPRNRKTYRLDTRIIEAMDKVAKAGGFKNPSEWLENHLFLTLKNTGHIGKDEKALGETRGAPAKKESGDHTKSASKEELGNAANAP